MIYLIFSIYRPKCLYSNFRLSFFIIWFNVLVRETHKLLPALLEGFGPGAGHLLEGQRAPVFQGEQTRTVLAKFTLKQWVSEWEIVRDIWSKSGISIW